MALGIQSTPSPDAAGADSMQTADTPQRLHYMLSLVDHIPSMLAYWDRELHCCFANQAYRTWFGTDPDRLIGMHIKDLLGEALYTLNLPHIQAVLRGEAQHFERDVPSLDGQIRHSLITYLPDWQNGEVQGFFVQVTDVTVLKETEAALRLEIGERRHIETELQHREAELREAQRLAGVGSWEWDRQRDMVSWSEQMYRVLGRDPKLPAPTYQELKSIYPPQSLVQREAAIERALTTGEPYMLEVEFTRPDGTLGWLLTHGEAMRDAHGAIIGLRGTAQDVSERHEAEALRRARDLAEASSLLKAQFLSRASHELRTPLNGVLGFAQLLGLDGNLGPRQRAWVAQILDSGKQLLHLVDELLDLSVAEGGIMRLHTQRVDLHDALDAAIARVADRAARAQVTLVNRVPSLTPLYLQADPYRLTQIVGNLLSNAIKYNRPDGQVTISAQVVDDGIEFSVADTGLGMNAAQLARLFNPFDRLGAEASKTPGTGVGLALTKRLTEAMGGSLRVASQPDQGSTFTVKLPAATPP